MLIIRFLLWSAGVIVGGYLVLTVFSIGADSPIFALIIAVPFLLLSFAVFPFTVYSLIRKIAFYVGLSGWILLTFAILKGMFGAMFVLNFLIYSGVSITLFTVSAAINNNRKTKK